MTSDGAASRSGRAGKGRGHGGSRLDDGVHQVPSWVTLVLFSLTMLPLAFSENIARAFYLATGNAVRLGVPWLGWLWPVLLIDVALSIAIWSGSKAARVAAAWRTIRRHERASPPPQPAWLAHMGGTRPRPPAEPFDPWTRRRLLRRISAQPLVTLGVLLVVVVDVLDRLLGPGRSFWLDVLISLMYASAIGVLVLGLTTGITWHEPETGWRRPKGSIATMANFQPAVPVLLGTFVAFVATNIWDWFLVAPGTIAVDNPVGGSGDPCRGMIDQEYFAQVAQIIPVLLIAIGVEAAFFREMLRHRVQRAVTEFAVVVLCLGEVLALSALTRSNTDCGSVLSSWHEYIAFVLTAEACFVAIATLAWALLRTARDESGGADT